MNDHLLLLAADLLDDLERTRIATDNRLRSLVGYGLNGTPEFDVLSAVLAGVVDLEHAATLSLQRAMKRHPLALWVNDTKGVGLKSAARLLAVIGDPYWNTLHNQPRTVSELWAFCGLHVVPAARQSDGDDPQPSDSVETIRESPNAEAPPSGAVADQTTGDRHNRRYVDAHTTFEGAVPGVAPRRRKGQRANWSTKAKTRAYLVAESCVKQLKPACNAGRIEATDGQVLHVAECACSPYRRVYDTRRQHTAVTRLEWTDGHHHADALRITAKAILRDLWLLARAIHQADQEDAA